MTPDDDKPATDVAAIVPDPATADAGPDGPPTPQGAYGVPAHGDVLEEHPELLAGAALAGGFVLAKLLKRLGRGDD
jgi:hypothetical protein